MIYASIFYSLLIGIHVLVAFLLIVIILMQAAKGGGLSGAFGTGMGSSPLFGAATSSVLVRTTTVMAIVFAITCISIAAIQSRRAIVMRRVEPLEEEGSVEPKEGKEVPPAVEGEKEEKPLSPVEAGEGEKEEEKALSPVEGGTKEEPGEKESEQAPGPGTEPAPPRPEDAGEESLSPVEGESASENR